MRDVRVAVFDVRVAVLLAALALAIDDQPAAAQTPSKKMKVFVLAGQSNMVGWGNSLELPEPMREGNPRVVMFEDGRWQPLKPFNKALNNRQLEFGLQEYTFGPEIAFAHEMAKAYPGETVGIVKLAVGGTSILAWRPDWTKSDADRVGQGRHGPLYRKLIDKLRSARRDRELEIVAFLWLQGGGDMRNVDVAREHLDHLKSLVAAVRQDAGVADLPFIYGSRRDPDTPDDLSAHVPKLREGRWPAVEWVWKAHSDAQQQIPHSKMIILRDVECYPMNVHYNTDGQLKLGRMFARAMIDLTAGTGATQP